MGIGGYATDHKQQIEPKIGVYLAVQSESQRDLGVLLLCMAQMPVAAAAGRASQRGDESATASVPQPWNAARASPS